MRYILTLMISLLLSCSIFKIPFKKQIVASPDYPGVNSQIAQKAVNKSRNYFVSKEEEKESEKFAARGKGELEKSESLFKAIEFLKKRVKADTAKKAEKPKERIVEKLTDDADIIIIRTTEEIVVNKSKTKRTAEQEKILELYAFEESLLGMLNQLYLDNAMENFRLARRKNKFNLEITKERARIFHKNIGELQKDPEGFKKSAQELEKIIQFHKDDYDNFWRLGISYEYLGNWKRAYENYKQALYVFDNVDSLGVISDSQKTKQDTLDYYNTRFGFLTDRARAEVKLFMPDSALLTLYKAMGSVTDVNGLLYIQDCIKNIFWDNKNISSFMMRDSAYSLITREKYDSAYVVLVNLLDTLKTQNARDEIINEIAWIEYYAKIKQREKDDKLKQKQRSLARVINILKESDANHATPDSYEAPFNIHEFNFYYLDSTETKLLRKNEPNALFSIIVKNGANSDTNNTKMQETVTFVYDSTYKNIFKDIGQMCLDYALNAHAEGRFHEAKKYFEFVTKIDWKGRGKGYLGLVPLHRRKDLRVSIKLCQKAFEYHKDLNQEEREKAIGYMIRLLKKMRKKELARHVHNIRKRGEPIPWDDLIAIEL